MAPWRLPWAFCRGSAEQEEIGSKEREEVSLRCVRDKGRERNAYGMLGKCVTRPPRALAVAGARGRWSLDSELRQTAPRAQRSIANPRDLQLARRAHRGGNYEEPRG